MSPYTINLTLSGYEAQTGRYYGFRRVVGEARTRKQAEEKYNTFAASHHFKKSVNHGIFLSIVKDGKCLFRQQIN